MNKSSHILCFVAWHRYSKEKRKQSGLLWASGAKTLVGLKLSVSFLCVRCCWSFELIQVYELERVIV